MGDCYEAGCRLILELDDFKYRLVHGMVNGQGKLSGLRFGHCWVETSKLVYDFSNGRELVIPKEEYYAIGRINPNECKYYTCDEAREWILKTQHWGAWEMSGDTVLAEGIPRKRRDVGRQRVRLSKAELRNLLEWL